jgi:hypothetical protein
MARRRMERGNEELATWGHGQVAGQAGLVAASDTGADVA